MSKNSSRTLMSNNQSFGAVRSVLCRNKRRECFYQEKCVLRTINAKNTINFRKKFWDFRNYKNHMENGCNLFRWLGDEIFV